MYGMSSRVPTHSRVGDHNNKAIDNTNNADISGRNGCHAHLATHLHALSRNEQIFGNNRSIGRRHYCGAKETRSTPTYRGVFRGTLKRKGRARRCSGADAL